MAVVVKLLVTMGVVMRGWAVQGRSAREWLSSQEMISTSLPSATCQWGSRPARSRGVGLLRSAGVRFWGASGLRGDDARALQDAPDSGHGRRRGVFAGEVVVGGLRASIPSVQGEGGAQLQDASAHRVWSGVRGGVGAFRAGEQAVVAMGAVAAQELVDPGS